MAAFPVLLPFPIYILFLPLFLVNSSLSFPHTALCLPSRSGARPWGQRHSWPDGEALDEDGGIPGWPGPQHPASSGQKPCPLSLLVLPVVQCGLLALPARSISVMWCLPCSALAAPVLSSTLQRGRAQPPSSTSGLRRRLTRPCRPWAAFLSSMH